jgi:hypothetical protein
VLGLRLVKSPSARTNEYFVLLEVGPYRLEGGGITSGFMLPLGLMVDGVDGRVRGCRQDGGGGR